MSETAPLRVGQTLIGPLFNEPMRVETVSAAGDSSWVVGLVGAQSERFRRVTMSESDLAAISILDAEMAFNGDGNLLRLGIQAYTLGIAYDFDPYFGLSISRVDPLPHQLEAVYDYLLKLARVRFLLADDAGAGKTIMAGLLIKELKLRGMCERILIVAPANLAFQWQRELKEKFDEKFFVIKGDDIRDQFGVNQWLEQKQLITSLDLAKRMEILPGLRQVHWDLIIVDEAHRMSWSPPARKTARYALGELLRDISDHMLLLTATPHKGDPANFSLFLQLLDVDAYADVKSIREAMDRRRAPFYLRRTKEAMVYFPERQPDNTWVAKKIFTKRIPHTVDFHIDGAEFDLYKSVTRFVKRQSARAAAASDDPRARAVGFLMALYQRRLASSTHAVCCSLENRAKRLDVGLRKAQEVARTAPPDLPDADELEEMEEGERERLEHILEAISLAGNAEEVRAEIGELKQLAMQAKAVESSGVEAKLSRLKNLMQEQGFFDHPDQRLLLFTEFKDTLDYLVAKLVEWGFRVGSIHGSMRIGSRDDPGSRLHTEQQFREGAIQILVATEAAGEGINLQCCNILFNYDIPWNPNRLEQRMGRIHRYGQTKNCLIFNYVATNTIEGRVLQRLLDKLQEIRNALNDDAVFNVVGEVLPATQIERVLRDYYAGHLGDADLEDRLLLNVDEGRFRAICQNALEGLASKRLNLEMLIERRAKRKSAASFQRPLRVSFPTLRDFRGSPSRPCRRSRTHMIRAARRTFSRTTSGTRTGVCHRSLRSIPGYPRIARQRTLITSNGLRQATRSSRRSAGTHFIPLKRTSRRGLASSRSLTKCLSASTSIGPASSMASDTSSTNGCSPSKLPMGTTLSSANRPSCATSPQPSLPTRCPTSLTCRKPRPGCTTMDCDHSSTKSAPNGSPRWTGSPTTSNCR